MLISSHDENSQSVKPEKYIQFTAATSLISGREGVAIIVLM
jgi:hypothetical protein